MKPVFSRSCKEYLSRVPIKARHCRLAELHALIVQIGALSVEENGRLALILQSENLPAVRRAEYLIWALTGYAPDCSLFMGGRNKAPFYSLTVPDAGSLLPLMKELGLMNRQGAVREKALPAPASLLKKECCTRAFLRGSFLGGGYISDPESAYHWEILCVSEGRAWELSQILQQNHIRARLSNRKGRVLLYVKEGEAISDLLTLMGATASRLEWENARALRSLQGQVNRQVNCETANLEKTTQASEKQRQAIRTIEEKAGLSVLPSHLKEMALLRIEYPEASLTELGALLDPPVGRSGVNHRLRKIQEIADSLTD